MTDPKPTSLWAKRPRMVLTLGFQVGTDNVVAEVDLLHWHFAWALGRSFSSVAIGPFAFYTQRAGGLQEQMEIMESVNER